jgi:hypothetical protein
MSALGQKQTFGPFIAMRRTGQSPHTPRSPVWIFLLSKSGQLIPMEVGHCISDVEVPTPDITKLSHA